MIENHEIDMRGKTEHQVRVEKFMRLAEQAAPSMPTLPDYRTRELRAALILEEALETIKALGFEVGHTITQLDSSVAYDRGRPEWVPLYDPELRESFIPDLVEIADGVADISVVSVGTLIACGLRDDPILRLVDENNLAKFGPGGKRRADGKWQKPPDHVPPDLHGEIQRQSAQYG